MRRGVDLAASGVGGGAPLGGGPTGCPSLWLVRGPFACGRGVGVPPDLAESKRWIWGKSFSLTLSICRGGGLLREFRTADGEASMGSWEDTDVSPLSLRPVVLCTLRSLAVPFTRTRGAACACTDPPAQRRLRSLMADRIRVRSPTEVIPISLSVSISSSRIISPRISFSRKAPACWAHLLSASHPAT